MPFDPKVEAFLADMQAENSDFRRSASSTSTSPSSASDAAYGDLGENGDAARSGGLGAPLRAAPSTVPRAEAPRREFTFTPGDDTMVLVAIAAVSAFLLFASWRVQRSNYHKAFAAWQQQWQQERQNTLRSAQAAALQEHETRAARRRAEELQMALASGGPAAVAYVRHQHAEQQRQYVRHLQEMERRIAPNLVAAGVRGEYGAHPESRRGEVVAVLPQPRLDAAWPRSRVPAHGALASAAAVRDEAHLSTSLFDRITQSWWPGATRGHTRVAPGSETAIVAARAAADADAAAAAAIAEAAAAAAAAAAQQAASTPPANGAAGDAANDQQRQVAAAPPAVIDAPSPARLVCFAGARPGAAIGVGHGSWGWQPPPHHAQHQAWAQPGGFGGGWAGGGWGTPHPQQQWQHPQQQHPPWQQQQQRPPSTAMNRPGAPAGGPDAFPRRDTGTTLSNVAVAVPVRGTAASIAAANRAAEARTASAAAAAAAEPISNIFNALSPLTVNRPTARPEAQEAAQQHREQACGASGDDDIGLPDGPWTARQRLNRRKKGLPV
jgi:hypothetical protein